MYIMSADNVGQQFHDLNLFWLRSCGLLSDTLLFVFIKHVNVTGNVMNGIYSLS